MESDLIYNCLLITGGNHTSKELEEEEETWLVERELDVREPGLATSERSPRGHKRAGQAVGYRCWT